MLTRIIPCSGEEMPVIGLGTWKTFDTSDHTKYPQLRSVLEAMHEAGGRVIDTSPMYKLSEQVIGEVTVEMPEQEDFFYATKVWTTGKEEGIEQMERSMSLLKRTTLDLIQIHNLVDWKTHLKTLRKWKEEGRIRYLGITHYTDDSHEMLESVLREESFDFVQFNYSATARHAEERLLPFCADNGIATIINRPFGEGRLFTKLKNVPLPDWIKQAGINSWADFSLRYIISHPAVTCVIPATDKPHHASSNALTATGKLPDESLRKKMRAYIDSVA